MVPPLFIYACALGTVPNDTNGSVDFGDDEFVALAVDVDDLY